MKTFFLFLDAYTANIFDGIKTRQSRRGPYIQLPLIEGVPTGKFSIPLDRKNPAIVDKGKIHEIFFKIYGGQRFRDAGFVTACSPTKDTGAIAIFTSKRWPEIGLKIMSGQPNGEFPGVQILNEGDIIGFTHAGISYQLTNSGGEPWLSREKKSKPAVKQAKKKPKPDPKNSQIAKFEKKYRKAKSEESYTLKEALNASGVKLPQG